MISDTSTEIVDSNSNYLKQAVLCTVYNNWTKLTGSNHIWFIEHSEIQGSETVYFRLRFYIVGAPSSGTMSVSCDNFVTVFVNGINVECSGAELSYIKSCSILSALKSNLNIIIFQATNTGGPGGLIFKINIQSKI